MPIPIKHLAQKILNNPKFIKITPENTTNEDISQRYYIINDAEREEAIVRLIDSEMPSKAIIFTRMKKEADILAKRLIERGYKACAMHGDMEQRERHRSIKAFKDSKSNILVATDIAARGLDISGVSHVFNFHIPLNPESYVHRIGRTGRAGKKGVAITLATPLEFKELRRIKENTKATIELYEIPNIQDTISKKDTQWIEKILKYPISDEALRLYEQVRSSADMTQLVCKLLSMLLEEVKVLGPNKIGLRKKDLQKFQRELRQEEKATYKKQKPDHPKKNDYSKKQNQKERKVGQAKKTHKVSNSTKTKRNSKRK